MAKRKFGECTYCGRQSRLTDDHIPPRSLFDKPLPPDLIKIPSCGPCNNEASKDDEYFKTTLVFKDRAGDYPEAVAIRESVFRSLQMVEKVGFSRALFRRMTPVSIFTPAGLYLGRRMAFHVDLFRLDRVVSRITKGLFYFLRGHRLAAEYTVTVYSEAGLCDLEYSVIQELRDKFLVETFNSPEQSIGRGAVRYRVLWSEKPPVSFWIHEFYSDVRFAAFITPLQPKVADEADKVSI